MTATIIAMPTKRPDDGYNGEIDPRGLAIERAMQTIECELHRHLDAVERIAVTRALEQLADDCEHLRRREPWC